MENKKYKTKDLIGRFIPYFKPYKNVLLLDLFCAFLTTGCDLILPMILRFLANKGTEDLSSITVQLIASLAGVYLVLRIIDAIANYYMTRIGHIMGARIETDMRKDAFDHIQKLSDSYFNNTKVGQIMSRITNDLFDVTEFAHHCPEEFFIAGVKIVISFILLSRINLALTTIIFIFIPLMVIFSMDQNRKMKRAFKKQRVQIGELNSRLEDSLLGVRVVKAFANEDIEAEKFTQDNRKFLGTKKETYKYMAGFKIITCIFDGIMYLVLLIAGGIFMMKGLIQPADLFVFTLYVTTLLATVKRIVEFTEQFQKGMTGIERFIEIMDSDIDIFDDEDAKELNNVKGSIEFKNVSFGYNDKDKEVLSNINLSIKEGEKVALVGPSGGGKTTICNLIPRFYDTTQGSIYLDNNDIKKVTLKSLRKNIGIVQQDVYLFAGTVYENIAYGNENATLEDVKRVAKLAQIDDFIEKLPNGYNTIISGNGDNISKGQKQLINIARAMLIDAKMLILDEATSNIDSKTEIQIQNALLEIMKGKTCFIIAHRLSTIKNADQILNNGKIVEQGKHEELLEEDGFYANLFKSQF